MIRCDRPVFTLLFLFVIASGAFTSASTAGEPLPAFPGAEGFNTPLCTHGRGGRVMVVTSLDDSKQGRPAEGTFRWACESTDAPWIVVFAVGGVLALQKEVAVRPNIYIAGQTAPGDGICLTQAGLKLGSNTLIRHVRFRLGDKMPGAALTKRDAFESRGDDIVIDHCSFAWTTDECFRVNGGTNVTLSYCFLGEGLHINKRAEMHNYGPALEPNAAAGGMSKNIAFHHCLLNGFAARSPLIGNGDREVHLLFANNVVYNYGGLKYPPVHTYKPKAKSPAFGRTDLIANYFKEGPVTVAGSPVVQVHGDYPNGGIYFHGNLSSTHRTTDGDEWSALMAHAAEPAVKARRSESAHHEIPGLTLTNAATAFERVLAQSGATFPKRDAVDERFVRDVRSGTDFRGTDGSRSGEGYASYYDYIFSDPAEVLNYHTTREHKQMKLTDIDPVPGGKEFFASFRGGSAPQDADADGISDAWEKTHGLDPSDPQDNVKAMPSGYTAIEEYVNSLPAMPAR